MKSMTGFGSASSLLSGRRLTVDARSVNGKFLDVSFRLPPRWDHLERLLSKAVRSRVFRGKVVISVYWSAKGGRSAPLSSPLFRAYARELRIMRPGPVSRADILHALAALSGNAAGLPAEGDAGMCVPLVERAVDDLVCAREAEGGQIKDELTVQLEAVSDCMDRVSALTPEIAREAKTRLEAALQRLGEAGVEASADKERISREVALLLVRGDAREEIVRVQAHVEAWRSRMESPGPHGRMLEFLVQEMLRELNTLAAKSASLEVTRLTLAARATVEQMREQVANVE